jgi:hypothetical protein
VDSRPLQRTLQRCHMRTESGRLHASHMQLHLKSVRCSCPTVSSGRHSRRVTIPPSSHIKSTVTESPLPSAPTISSHHALTVVSGVPPTDATRPTMIRRSGIPPQQSTFDSDSRAAAHDGFRILARAQCAHLHLMMAVGGWLVDGRTPFGLFFLISAVDEVTAAGFVGARWAGNQSSMGQLRWTLECIRRESCIHHAAAWIACLRSRLIMRDLLCSLGPVCHGRSSSVHDEDRSDPVARSSRLGNTDRLESIRLHAKDAAPLACDQDQPAPTALGAGRNQLNRGACHRAHIKYNRAPSSLCIVLTKPAVGQMNPLAFLTSTPRLIRSIRRPTSKPFVRSRSHHPPLPFILHPRSFKLLHRNAILLPPLNCPRN